MSAASSPAYFDRLLARLQAQPSGAGQALLDDPFERTAPLAAEWPAVDSAVGIGTRARERGAGVPQTAKPAGQGPLPELPDALLPRAPRQAEPVAARSDVAPPSAAPAAIAAPAAPAYLNQDELLGSADAFFDRLYGPVAAIARPLEVPHGAGAAEPLAPAPVRAAEDPARPEIAAPAASLAPALPPRRAASSPAASLEPPAASLEPPAALAPRAQVAAERHSAPRRDAPVEQAAPPASAHPAAPAPVAQPVLISIAAGKSAVTLHAQQLGASPHFGIGQL